MKFEYFEIKNFKGIVDLKINLTKSPKFNVHAFVGLNESGKTTILEAINFFKHKTEPLDSLELKGYKIEDIHDIIPISQRDNFNGFVEISGGLLLEEADEIEIKKFFKTLDIHLSQNAEKINFTQRYYFEDSKSNPSKDSFVWEHNFHGKKATSKIVKRLMQLDAVKALPLIRSRIPNIMYFPNFLFDFPNKIYLSETIEDKKYIFYQGVIQDILDSLDNKLNIETHIINRAESTEVVDKRHLQSVLDKMGGKVTFEVFDAWGKIFNKTITKKEIIINQEKDSNGIYLEFLLKDTDGKYLIMNVH